MADKYPARRALISVSDKTGLVELAEGLAGHGIALLSTGGTAGLLRDAGLAVTEVSDVTGFPEIMDGRVKTLHPKVHGALLAVRDDPAHREAMDTHGIEGIDILIANLYPFEATIAEGAEYGEAVEQIDIGGPAMIRAAAKNHAYVSVVVDPEDYGALLVELEEGQGATGYAFRQRLALTAYGRTAAYDAAVSSWMTETLTERAPRRMSFAGIRAQELRYGENPHQAAGFYRGGPQRAGISTAQQWQGKDLSYNNINDTDAAFELVAEFPAEDGPACAIIKHANPCGVATGTTLQEAYARAFDCDRISAFGGIVALNQTLDAETARAITEILTEVVIAPDADSAAKDVFAAKRNLRLLTTGCLPDPAQPGLAVKQVAGGFLLQDRDNGRIAASDLKVVTKRAPDDREMDDLLFAWIVAKHVKSNAIVYAKNRATVGVGAGQMSRVDSAAIAALKAGRMADDLGLSDSPAEGSVVASDAFFPFADGLLAAAAAGATAVIQPGGSVRDDEVIAAADKAGLAMVFTGQRHFRH